MSGTTIGAWVRNGTRPGGNEASSEGDCIGPIAFSKGGRSIHAESRHPISPHRVTLWVGSIKHDAVLRGSYTLNALVAFTEVNFWRPNFRTPVNPTYRSASLPGVAMYPENRPIPMQPVMGCSTIPHPLSNSTEGHCPRHSPKNFTTTLAIPLKWWEAHYFV